MISARALAVVAVLIEASACTASAPAPEVPTAVVSVASPTEAPKPTAEAPRRAPLVVGVLLPMSGEDSAFGIDTLRGVQLGFDAAARATPGRFELVIADDKSNPQEASNAALAFAIRGAVGILGDVASSRSRAAGIVAQKKGVPLLTPMATNPDVVKVGPFVFRACFDDDIQGRAAAAYVIKNLGKKRIAILFAADDLYSSGLEKSFADEAGRLGASIVGQRSFLKKETDFVPALREIKSSRPEAVFMPTYYTVMPAVARAAKVVGLPPSTFLGGDGWDAAELLRDAGTLLEGASFTNHWALDVPTERSRAFVASFRERFHADPTSLAAMGFEAAGIFVSAVDRAKEPTPSAVRDALAETRGFPGLAGPVSFGPDRVTRKSVVVVQIKDAKFVFRDLADAAP